MGAGDGPLLAEGGVPLEQVGGALLHYQFVLSLLQGAGLRHWLGDLEGVT